MPLPKNLIMIVLSIFMILNDLFNNYISFYELILSPTTLRSDIATYNKHFKNSLGLREIEDINRHSI